ncbi:MAG: hypothetical protein J1E35_10155 [Lachnospiraceae bacterium]|nr:hypothetical protein [Lachnospiraceae bacterium]
MKKEGRKKISFVLFVMSIFFAGVVLAEFHSSVWMVIIAGVELVAASCFFIWDRESREQSPSGKTADILFADRMAEWMRGNEKAEKGVYIAVKKQQEAMTEGMSALEEKLSEVIKAQENSIKTLILYNRENAKQLALNEREELGRLRLELQNARTGFEALAEQMQNQESAGNAVGSVADGVVEGIGEIKELLGALKESSQRLTELIENMEKFPAAVSAPKAEPKAEVMPESVFDLGAEPEAEVMPESVFDLGAEPEAEAVPESVFDLGAEPEAASMPEPEFELPTEPEAEPIPEPEPEPKQEDALAASGVDLSDPNKALSADDIAALFAALGN